MVKPLCCLYRGQQFFGIEGFAERVMNAHLSGLLQDIRSPGSILPRQRNELDVGG